MADIYYNNASPQQFDWKNAQGNVQGSTGNPELDKKLAGLSPEERIKIQQQAQEPLTGEEVALAMKQNVDFTPTKTEYQQYLGFHKTEHHSIFEGIGAGASAILHDFANAGNALIDHPISALAKAPASLVEAFMQGSRNLYGMVAQSQDPTSPLFKLKDALAGNGSDAGYQQFLDARKFNKYSSQLADGSETMVVDKDLIDHDLTLAMSYIADPTLAVPYLGQVSGATKAISSAMRATAMGEKIANIAGKVGTIKAGIIGGTLKYAVGAPLEMVGGTIRGTIDATAKAGASILETTTGIGAAEAKSTLRGVGVTSTAASFAGHGIPVVSDISNVYLGANAARGAGEAIKAIGNQIIEQGGKRGFNSFAAQAMIDTEKAGIQLSGQAKGLLRVINAVDPIFSYGASAANGITHGAMIGGSLGYLSGGEEGAYHGIGAGMALGGIGATGGKIFSDISGGTKWQRAEIQGGFALDVMKTENPTNHKGWSLILEGAKTPEQRRVVLQAIAGIDNIAGDHSLFVGDKDAFEASVKSQGYDLDGRHIDPKTGEATIGKDGKPVERMATANEFHGTEGFVVTKADGKIGIHINLEKWANNKSADVFPHEIFHAVMRQTDMYKQFLGGWTEHLLGKFGADGTKLESAKVDPTEFMEFQKRYIERMVDANGKPVSKELKANKLELTKTAMDEFAKAGGDLAKMHEANPEAAAHLKYQSEEFGAYYYTQWIKGKPLDYLFYGGKLPTIRGALDSMGNRWVDFWANKVNKEAPSFNFNAKDANGNRVGLDAAFSGNGEGRVRVPAMDLMLQDLIRAQSGQKSKNAVTVGAMTPTGRLNWIKNNGVDGMIHAIDPQTGAWLGINKVKYGEWQKQNAKDVVSALNQLHGKNEDSYTGNRTDAELKHLVEQGVWTQAFADRIKSFQEAIASPDASNLYHHDYHGDSQETGVGTSRLRGDEVPVTNRSTIPVKLDLNFHKDGTYAALLHSVDMKVMNERVNTEWSKPEVRALWGDNRGDMMDDFIKYINNAAKDKDARIESALLLEDGRGNGAQIRNIFHQMLGFAKSEKVDYFNPAIKDIVREKFGTFQTLKVDLMSPLSHDSSAPRLNVSQDSFKLLSRNFKVDDMAEEKTPNGVVYTHETGYKIIKDDKTGNIKAFDTEGKLLGVFKDSKQAENATKTHYEAEQAKIPKMQAEAAKAQDKVQKGFKVLTEEDKAQAVERKDVFKTDKMQDFSHGTEVIPQTREEFYNEHFLKLRQSDPATVLAITEDVLARSDVIRKQKDAIQVQMDAAEKGGSKARDGYLKLRDEFQRLERMVRTDDLQRVYNRAKTSGADIGQAVLDYINTSRKNGLRYDEMAKQFFGASFDSKTATGKPVTVVATHGTNSPQLLLDMHFDPSKLGVSGRHGSAADGIGAFLSGEIKTSRGYGVGGSFDHNYRQVRAAVRFDNPLVIDGEFNNYSPKKYEGYIKAGIEGGHDGLIIQNIYDGGSADTVYVPFKKGLADKTVIIDSFSEDTLRDTASRDVRMADKKFPFGESTEEAYPVTTKEPLPRGVKTMRDFTGSWKVGDDNAPAKQDKGIPSVLVKNIGADLLKKGIDSGKLILSNSYKALGLDRLKGIAHTADTMAVGDLKINNKTIENLQGGMFFHMLHGDLADFWASTFAGEGESSVLVKWLNEAIKVNGRKFNKPESFITLVKPDNDKIFQSPTGTRSVLQILDHLVDNGAMSSETLKQHMIDSSNEQFVSGKKKGTDKQKISFDETESYKDIMAQSLEELPQHSFDNRKLFIQSLFSRIAKSKEISGDAYLQMRKAIGDGSWNEKNTSKFTAAEANRVFGDLLAEPMIRDVPKGHAYAIIKINSPIVERVDSGLHDSYRSSVAQTSGDKPIMAIMERTAPAWDVLNNAKNERIQEYNKERKMSYVNELGGSQNPYAKVTAKRESQMPFKVSEGIPLEGHSPADSNRELIQVDVKQLNAYYARTSPSDTAKNPANQKPNSLQRATDWIEKKPWARERYQEMAEAPRVQFSDTPRFVQGEGMVVPLAVDNGRHRLQAYENLGHEKAWIQVPKDQVSKFDQFRVQDLNKPAFKVSERGQKMFDANIKEFGITTEPSEAGYILPSGKKTVTKLDPEAHYKVSDLTPEQRKEKVTRFNEIKALVLNRYSGGLSAKEGAEYAALMREAQGISFDLRGGRGLKLENIPSMESRGSSIPSDVVKVASDELSSNRAVHDVIGETAQGVYYNKDTSVDDVFTGKNPDVSPQELYNAFEKTRQALRQIYGDTIDLYRAHGKQKDKHTQLWASSEKIARSYGKNIEKRSIPIDNILALNVGLRGTYEEFFVGKPPTVKPIDANLKVSDAGIARVQEKVDYLKGLMDRYEKFKDAKGRGNSDNKRRYWDAKREYNKLNDYTLKPMLAEMQKDAPEAKPDLKPFEGKFKVSEPVLKGVSKVDELIAQETDKSNLSPDVKANFAKFKEAIRKQNATDEVLIPEVRESYDALRDKINSELTNGLTLTPAPVLKSILKALDGIDKKLSKDASRIASRVHAGDMAEGAGIEAAQSAEQTAKIGAYRADQNEGADVESHITQQADLQEGADVEAGTIPKPSASNPAFPYPAPKAPAIPKPSPVEAKQSAPAVDQSAIDASKKAEFDKYQALKNRVLARNNPPASTQPAPAPITPTQTTPVDPFATGATPATPPNVQRLWRGYTAETSPNGTVWKNAVGWIIMNQGDKFKVYNPQQAVQGIYNDLESAKRRVQRAEPKQ